MNAGGMNAGSSPYFSLMHDSELAGVFSSKKKKKKKEKKRALLTQKREDIAEKTALEEERRAIEEERRAILAEELGTLAIHPLTKQAARIVNHTAAGKPIVGYTHQGIPIIGIRIVKEPEKDKAQVAEYDQKPSVDKERPSVDKEKPSVEELRTALKFFFDESNTETEQEEEYVSE